MSETETLTAVRTPTIYFIDDSATMREVIKIAFRKENIHVITCADAASALAQFGESAPDAVITDVIMPDKDGYQVCEFIKQHEQFGKIPVILMSGVVNRDVAEKAMAVKADELVRKPFQPQDLVVRVKNLLYPKPAASPVAPFLGDAASSSASNPLSTLFSASPAGPSTPFAASQPPVFTNREAAPSHAAPRLPAPIFAPRPLVPATPQHAQHASAGTSAEIQRLRNEVRRLELLVKKLQAELEAGQQYCAALEAHIKTLQGSE
jgi:CheY-like chemotaxis protein